jgi:catabolite regulation protein CreA
MARQQKKKTRDQAKTKNRPRIDINLAAECLVYAAFHGDEAASKKYGRTVRTIQRYRKRSFDDPELSGVVAYKISEFEQSDWPDALGQTIDSALSAVQTAMTELDKSKPESLEAIGSTLAVLFDYKLALELLNARTEENRIYTATDRQVGSFAGVQGEA